VSKNVTGILFRAAGKFLTLPLKKRKKRLLSNPPSACFQAGGLVVILVEVHVKSYLASMVPVIVNTILDQHQLVVDIVAFVGRGDFPRSRLGEKQRGKILASWVTRKMRTIAQFGIRDNHGGMGGNDFMGMGSSRPGSIRPPSQHLPSMLSETIMETPTITGNGNSNGSTPTQSFGDFPAPPVELPASNNSRVELPAMTFEEPDQGPVKPAPGYRIVNPEQEKAPTPPIKNPRRTSATDAGARSTMGDKADFAWADQYPSEAIMHMKLDDEKKEPGWGMAL
jgi:hypothetical protein